MAGNDVFLVNYPIWPQIILKFLPEQRRLKIARSFLEKCTNQYILIIVENKEGCTNFRFLPQMVAESAQWKLRYARIYRIDRNTGTEFNCLRRQLFSQFRQFQNKIQRLGRGTFFVATFH
jgi:hypothetical protein